MSKKSGNLPPVPPNPGGALEPFQVVGRDELIADFWRTLRVQSMALLAPRRIGKTSVLTRMAADPPAGFVVVRRDLEGLESTAELVQVLFEDVAALLGRWRCTARRASLFLDKLAVDTSLLKVELRGPHWKRLLDHLFEDLEEHLGERDELLVLMWDEVTLFIGDLIRRDQAGDAMALLDSLRAARQRHPHIRMLLTGSIGFDELLRGLRRSHDYRNRPLNDVARQFVPPLDRAGAEALIGGLLRHAGRLVDAELIAAMLDACEGHPFVIQLLADRLLRLPSVRAEHVEPHLRELLSPPGDPLDLGYYLERIATQFDAGEAAIARRVLDALARAEAGLTKAELGEALADVDRDALAEIVRHLEDDFYLRRDAAATRFMFEFLRRFWKEERCA